MLIIDRRDVERLLDPEELLRRLEPAMIDLSEGKVSMPERTFVRVEEHEGLLGVMPVWVPSLGTLSTKLVSVYPSNSRRDIETHQAVVVSFDPETGTPQALMDATAITAIRTATGSALATRLLARPDARVLAIVGTGVQARSHAEALPLVRSFEEIRIAGRDPVRAEALAAELAAEVDAKTTATPTPKEAVLDADVICVTTHSPEPVIRRGWVAPGVHVNSVGVNPAGGEIDPELVRDALVAVEQRAAALADPPSGAMDLTGAGLGGDALVEMGELLSGRRPGRTSPDQITLYKSVGVAVQDAAAAAVILERAEAEGAGTQLAL